MFLSWGAEEYSLCGSREFVEQYEMEVSERSVELKIIETSKKYLRGVAYINTDVCMSGPILEPVASPTLMDILVPATRDIVSPEDESQSYYDYWQQWSGQGDSFDPEVGCMTAWLIQDSDSISRFGVKICCVESINISFCWIFTPTSTVFPESFTVFYIWETLSF